MGSLRTRLFALWFMLAVSGSATGFLLLEFYRQSANAQVGRAEEVVSRACREIGDRYASLAANWRGSPDNATSDELREQLTTVVQATLARAPGVEGGIWRANEGTLAYAFPTYEGTGPKTDVPSAELAAIGQINADALRGGLPVTMRQIGRSQVLAINACPLKGPLTGVTAWTMTRVFTGQGPAYNQLLVGLAILAATVLGSAAWLGSILYSWSRRLTALEAALASHDLHSADLPPLPLTGERELDRLVQALNATGARLADERRRAGAAERLAAVGRLAAGLSHEIRNPIAAMRLKAENALAAINDERRISALRSILEQVGRLDALLRDLLAMTQRREPELVESDLAVFLERTAEAHRELAASKGVKLVVGSAPAASSPPLFDDVQMHRALDNLILNAIENTPVGGTVEIAAEHNASNLRLRVRDTGHGVPDSIRERLFEPFVTGRPEGTGLGLAVVREIARAHGGEARLVPTTEGAEFEIEVPWQTS
jgi:signal transduction histidine kinase